MVAQLLPLPKFQFITDDGDTADGYNIYTYEAGTSTPKNTYTTSVADVPNTNPVVLDTRGEADIWFDGLYKIRITDRFGDDVYEVDNYGAGTGAAGTGAAGVGLILNGGFESDENGDGTPDEWVLTQYDIATSFAGIDSTTQIEGTNSLRFISTGLGGGFGVSSQFPVREGRDYRCEFMVQSSVTDVRNIVDVLWYRLDGTLISSSIIYDSTANPTNWERRLGTVSAPALTRFARVRMSGCHFSNATPGNTWFDDVSIGDPNARLTDAQVFTKRQTWRRGADIASVQFLDIPSDGNYFDVTGTTNIQGFNTVGGPGTVIKLHFNDVLTLEYNSFGLQLPDNNNIVTQEGDEFEFVEYNTGGFRCTNYLPKVTPPIIVTEESHTAIVSGDLYRIAEIGVEIFGNEAGLTRRPNFVIVVPRSGEYRISFSMSATSGTGAAEARVFINRSTDYSGEIALGALHTQSGIPFVERSDENVMLSAGDVLVLYSGRGQDISGVRVRNFILSSDTKLFG